MENVEYILTPVDFSEPSFEALELAAATALRQGAELVVLHVSSWPGPDLGYLSALNEKEKTLEKLKRTFREKVAGKPGPTPWPPEKDPVFLVREGLPPADEILRVIREKGIGLVVMGTHGRHGLAKLVLGSVAEKVVREAPCRVMVCRGPVPVGAVA